MKAKQLQHLHTTVAALKDQLQSGRKVVKYIRNVKNQDTLQKPRYQPIGACLVLIQSYRHWQRKEPTDL
jgi:hypothetical protein